MSMATPASATVPDGDRQWCTAVAAAAAIRRGELTASDLVEAALRSIAMADPHVGAFVEVDGSRALRAAARLDEEAANGRFSGPLHGVPIAVKDVFDVSGLPTRQGSAVYRDALSASTDATVVARLRAAGAIVVGKTRTHELACGVFTPGTNNPWSLDRSAGGSSGGSAAAIAARMVPAALGSDTAGSVRVPAALCATVGLKPTAGRMERAGMAPLSRSLDDVGLLARSVDDAALLLSVLDTAQRGASASTADGRQSLSDMRIGLPAHAVFDDVAPAVAHALAGARDRLRDLGAELVPVAVDEVADAADAVHAIVTAEAALLHQQLLQQSGQLLGPDVRDVLERGAKVPAVDYLRAQGERERLRVALRSLFSTAGLDGLLTPTVPATAPRHGQRRFRFADRTEAVTAALLRATEPFNLVGLPALALPAGLSRDGLPVSVQIVARPFAEDTVFRIARALESALDPVQPQGLPPGLAAALVPSQERRQHGDPARR